MKHTPLGLLALTVAACAFATPALAEGWAQSGDWLVRGRVIGVIPDESSSISPIGGEAKINNDYVPELDFTYFFTPNIAAELILATTKHDATAANTAGGTFHAGSTWVLPPTLTLQYHFTDWAWAKPYVGAGINYTIYYDEKAGAAGEMDLDNSFGLALQAGVDVPIDDKWSWNLDVKKIYTKADAKWPSAGVTANIDLDPWVIGTGVGYRF